MKIGKFKKILVAGLVCALSFGMITNTKIVNATGDGTTTNPDNSGIVLDKTATWNEESGEATIKLEAYATGSVQTGKTDPLDIVLVLDQSGSMKNNGYVDSLKTAVTSFVNTIKDDAVKKNVDHRVAIVGYASNQTDGKSNDVGGTKLVSPNSSDSYWINTGIFINGFLQNYQRYEQVAPEKYEEVYNLSNNQGNYYIKVDNEYKQIHWQWDGYWYGHWYYNEGRKQIEIAVKDSPNDSDVNNYQVYIHKDAEYDFVDLTSQDYKDALVSVKDASGNVNNSITTAINNYGYSGATRTSYGMEMAKKVFENNQDDDRQRVVVVFTDGKPGFSGYNSTEAGNAVNQSYEIKNTYGAKVYTVGLYNSSDRDTTNFMNYLSSNYPRARRDNNGWQNVYNNNDKESDKYYTTTSDSSKLDDIFNQIAEDISSSNTELDATAQITDVISDTFKAPSKSDIKAYTVDYKGDNQWYSLSDTGHFKILDPDNITNNNGTIAVTGFSYKDNYVLNEDPNNGNKPSGKKLVIEITVTPKDGFIGGNMVDTNGDAYISFKGEKVADFPKPHVDIALDYEGIEKDQTIYMGTTWNDIITMIENPNKDGFQYKNSRNKGENGQSQLTQYTIDGINNKYVDISYEVKQGTEIIATYKIPAGQTNGTWNPSNFDIKSNELVDCTDYTVSIKVEPKFINCDNNTHTSVKTLTKTITPTLHILKPQITVNDSTIAYGTNTNLNVNNIDEIIWSECSNLDGHKKTTSDVVSGLTEPTYRIEVNALENGNNLNKENDEYIFTPQKALDGKFELRVYNGNNNITNNVTIKNGTAQKNEFTVKVVSGELVINKEILDNVTSSSDGDPIFTFKITVNNPLLGNKVYYRYFNVESSSQYNILKDLPVGNYTIEELGTLRYEYDESNVESTGVTISNENTSEDKKVSYTITNFNLATNSTNNVTATFTNKLKSSDKDSDNGIVVNTFEYVNGQIQIGQKYYND